MAWSMAVFDQHSSSYVLIVLVITRYLLQVMDEIYTNIKITDFEINNINEIMYPSILSNTVITRRKQEFFLRLQVILLVDLLTSLYHSHYF